MVPNVLNPNAEPPIYWDEIGDWEGPAHELDYAMVWSDEGASQQRTELGDHVAIASTSTAATATTSTSTATASTSMAAATAAASTSMAAATATASTSMAPRESGTCVSPV
ncbi:unnamed protein product [Urochloa humidicola]